MWLAELNIHTMSSPAAWSVDSFRNDQYDHSLNPSILQDETPLVGTIGSEPPQIPAASVNHFEVGLAPSRETADNLLGPESC